MNNLEKLTKIIKELVPEITKLKRDVGCRVVVKKDMENFVLNYDYAMGANVFGAGYEITEIVVGRQITFDDVFEAIIKSYKLPRKAIFNGLNGYLLFEKWEPGKPLHLQSQETIDFLLDILK